MGVEYFFFYTEASIVCIAIFAILLFHSRTYGTRTERNIWFDRTEMVHIIYFLSDIGWAAVISGVLPRVRFLVVLFNLINYIFISLIAYCWFMYMVASEGMMLRITRKHRKLLTLPAVISTLVIVIAYIIDPLFWIDANKNLNDLYYPFMVSVPTLYVLSASIISLINSRETEKKEERKLYRLIAIYPLSIVSFGLLQTFALNAPLFCFGCTLMMLYFYIQSLQMLVSVDSLTKLNNRGQIDRYMDRIRYDEDEPCCICMLDIDNFKKINDTFGHAEGDRALVLVADAMRQTADRSGVPIFLGRFGGDEFTVIIRSAGDGAVIDRFAEAIRKTLKETGKKNRLPFDLEISLGYDFLKNGEDTPEDCLKRADRKLYQDKLKRGKGR